MQYKQSTMRILLIMLCGTLLAPLPVTGCGPIYEEETALSLLLEMVASEESILWDYEESWDAIDERSRNIAEWQEFFWKNAEGVISSDEIETLLYDMSLERVLQLYHEFQENPSGRYWEDNYSRHVLQRMSRDTTDYIVFAKHCEAHVAVEYDPWDGIERDKAAMQTLLENGRQKYTQVRSDFLKLRYAYQLVRIARYIGNYAASVALYDELIAPLNNDSIIRYWALDQKAGALRHLGKTAEAAYLFSVVFGNAPERRVSAYRSFRMSLGNEQQWKQCLQYAKTPYEEITLWFLWNTVHGYGQSLELLQHLYELNPSSPVLESLLAKEIRAIERERTVPEDYRAQLHQFVLTAAGLGKIQRPAFWYAMAGYLAMLGNNYAEANKDLATAAMLCPPSQNVLTRQIALLQHILPAYRRYSTFGEEEELQIYADLHWLDSAEEYVVEQSLLSILAQKYLSQNDLSMAVLCLLKTPDRTIFDNSYRAKVLLDIYVSQDDFIQLIALLNQASHSSFESYLLQGLPYTVEELLELQGTRLLRQQNYVDALKTFQRIPEPYWQCEQKTFLTTFSQNPYHAPKETWEFETFTKLTFTEKILMLEQNIDEDPAHADLYYWQLGNGFYHTPFWGYADELWGANYCRCDCVSFSSYRYPLDILGLNGMTDFFVQLDEKAHEVLKDCPTRQTALEYYQRVLDITTDPELGAETAILAHSTINPNKVHYDGYTKYFRSVDNTSYYQVLQERYSDTAFYDRMIEECATFKHFVIQQKKEKPEKP